MATNDTPIVPAADAVAISDDPQYRDATATTRKAVDEVLLNGGTLPSGVVLDFTTGAMVYRETKKGS